MLVVLVLVLVGQEEAQPVAGPQEVVWGPGE